MIISDLEVLEVVREENVEGAGGYYYKKPYIYPSAKAEAGADATAIGFKTETSTYTNAVAVSGVYSQSSSYSSAKASY